MDINALLDEVKLKLDVKTDYRMSKLLEIPEKDLSNYRKGKQIPDSYACFKFAEVLGKAPSVLIAQVQAENARSERKRLYFKRFFSIAWLWIILGLLWPDFGTSTANAYEAGSRASTSFTESAIMRNVRRWLRKTKLKFRYFTCNWNVKFA